MGGQDPERSRSTHEEQILDLACGTSRHTLELVRRGFTVVGVELLEANGRTARETAKERSLKASFTEADLRDLQFQATFDLVLSLNDGAIGYFASDAENLRVFEVISRALRSSGRHLAQIPNILHSERHPSTRDWIRGSQAIELIDHHWNERTRCLEGTTSSIWIGEVLREVIPLPFRKRLYSLDELTDIYASVGMSVTNVFRGNGKAGRPRSFAIQIFVEARKD